MSNYQFKVGDRVAWYYPRWGLWIGEGHIVEFRIARLWPHANRAMLQDKTWGGWLEIKIEHLRPWVGRSLEDINGPQ